MEHNALEVSGVSKTNTAPFKHYLRYNKVDSLKLQYSLDRFLSFSPGSEISNLDG